MTESFNEIELRKLDLNLLLVFSAIMREGSVNAAAKRLFLGPSAISMALTRLRQILDDPLFVRSPGGMVPTPRSDRLWADVEPALSQIEAATRVVDFDPSTAEADFILGAPDDLESVLVPRLMSRLACAAPRVRLVVQPMDFRNMFDGLDQRSVDLGLSALPSHGKEARHRTKILHREHSVALFDPKHVDAAKIEDLDSFIRIPQIMVSIRGDFTGPIDSSLAELGLKRTVVGTVARFTTIPFILRQRSVLACVPSGAARHMASEFSLSVRDLPFASPEFDLALAWHHRTDKDPAQTWFRELLATELNSLIEQ
ncbi:MAG: LysR family transcriptional regulator [Paracoccaceae bacterium]